MAEEKLPTPVEELEAQTKADQEELNKLPKSQEEADANEELEEESPPSDDDKPEAADPSTDGEEETTEEKPVVEDETQASKSQTDKKTGEEDEPPKDLSSRGQERFKVLTQKLKDKTTETDQLKELVTTLQGQGLSPEQAQQVAQDSVNPEGDQQQVIAQAEASARKIIQQERAIDQHKVRVDNYKEDLAIVEKDHNELNEDHPEYDENLSNLIGELYENRATKDHKVRLTDVAKEVLKLRDQQVEEAVAKKEGEIRKKVAGQALPASGGASKGDTLSDQIKNIETPEDLAKVRAQLPLGD